jgi:hypothetical protein
LDAAAADVIALDFDLASPMPDGTLVEHPDYQRETKELLRAIKYVSQRRKIVLPRTLDFDRQHNYVLRSDIYDGFDFGPNNENIYMGYIALPYDLRRIPGTRELKGKDRIDSFAMAIVKARDADALRRLPKSDSFLYGGYLRADDFPKFAAEDVLGRRREVINKLSHKIVIVSGGWHKQGYDRGDQIDLYLTPVGWIGGAFIHANFVEALLDGRAYKGWERWKVELLLSVVILVVAIFAALEIHEGWRLLFIPILCMLLFVISYLFLHNLGQFFDFSLPLILVLGHAALDQILEWRREALKFRTQREVRQ